MSRIKNEPEVYIGGGAYCSKPTLGQRIAWALGFCLKRDDDLFDWRTMDPPEEGFVVSCLHTETHCILDWKDRIRVLLTGHIVVNVWTKTDVFVKRSKSRSEVAVLPPIAIGAIKTDPR